MAATLLVANLAPYRIIVRIAPTIGLHDRGHFSGRKAALNHHQDRLRRYACKFALELRCAHFSKQAHVMGAPGKPLIAHPRFPLHRVAIRHHYHDPMQTFVKRMALHRSISSEAPSEQSWQFLWRSRRCGRNIPHKSFSCINPFQWQL